MVERARRELHMVGSCAVPRAVGGGSKATDAPKVVVVGERYVLVEALTRLLRATGILAAYTTPLELELTLSRERPEAVLVDGGIGAAELVRCVQLARHHPPVVRVLLLASDHDPAPQAVALQTQAAVCSWSTAEELVAAVSGQVARVPGGPRRAPERLRSRRLVGQLTPREVQVLRTLMAGASSPQIAERLGISPHTVRTHVQNILGKLNAGTRLEAVNLGFEQGLRPLSDMRVARR